MEYPLPLPFLSLTPLPTSDAYPFLSSSSSSLSLLLPLPLFSSLPLTPPPTLVQKFPSLKACNVFTSSVIFMDGGNRLPSGMPLARLSVYTIKKPINVLILIVKYAGKSLRRSTRSSSTCSLLGNRGPFLKV